MRTELGLIWLLGVVSPYLLFALVSIKVDVELFCEDANLGLSNCWNSSSIPMEGFTLNPPNPGLAAVTVTVDSEDWAAKKVGIRRLEDIRE